MAVKDSLMQPQRGRALSEILAAKGAAVAPTAEGFAPRRRFLSSEPYCTLELAAEEYASRGEHSRAIEEFSRAIPVSPFWAAPYIHWKRGDSYSALGRYEDAIADYEVPHCDDVCKDDEARRRWRLVTLLQESQQPERAIRALRELIDYCTSRIECRDGRYFYDRALARAGLKEYNKALDDCGFALEAGARPGTINELRAAILADSAL